MVVLPVAGGKKQESVDYGNIIVREDQGSFLINKM